MLLELLARSHAQGLGCGVRGLGTKEEGSPGAAYVVLWGGRFFFILWVLTWKLFEHPMCGILKHTCA